MYANEIMKTQWPQRKMSAHVMAKAKAETHLNSVQPQWQSGVWRKLKMPVSISLEA